MPPRTPINVVKEYIAKEAVGYTLLDHHYDTHLYIKVRCPNNHVYVSQYNNFKRGKRCKACTKISVEEVKATLAEAGYTLKGTYYGLFDYSTFVCPRGHEYVTIFRNFKKGHRCSECFRQRMLLPKEKLNDILKTYDLTLKSEYKGSRSRMLVECSKGHRQLINYESLRLRGYICFACKNIAATKS